MSFVKVGLADYSPMMGEVLLGNDTSLFILGVGDLAIIPNGFGGLYTSSVLHIPHLHYNLISVHEVCKLGLSLEFKESKLIVQDKHKKVLLEDAMFGLYKI